MVTDIDLIKDEHLLEAVTVDDSAHTQRSLVHNIDLGEIFDFPEAIAYHVVSDKGAGIYERKQDLAVGEQWLLLEEEAGGELEWSDNWEVSVRVLRIKEPIDGEGARRAAVGVEGR